MTGAIGSFQITVSIASKTRDVRVSAIRQTLQPLIGGHCVTAILFQVSSLVSSLLRKIDKIQNMMYHCSQLAIAIRGEQWLDTK